MSEGLLESAANAPASMFNPVGFVVEPAVKRLQSQSANVAEGIFALLDDTIIQAVNCPTVEDFRALRTSLFPSYVKLTLALGNVLLAKLDRTDLPGLIDDSFNILEIEFAGASSYFGDDANQEIQFSISTLRSAHRWLPHLIANKLEGELHQQDDEEARKFGVAANWSFFHLEALRYVLDKGQTIVPETLQEILDGLRFSVMAYAHVRTALELRNTPDLKYDEGLEILWDAEDEALANAD